MELFAAVQPLVLTTEGYQMIYGEEDPEELSLLQIQDKEVAEAIASVLSDLFFLETDLTSPKEGEGLAEEIGTVEDFQELKRIAAETMDHTVDDYQEGRVPAGFQYNHLINHADDSGYYLPVDFMQSFIVLDEVSVGSAVALLRELEALEPTIAASFPQEVATALTTADDEPLELTGPAGVWASLKRFCRSAIETDLPVQLG